MTERRTVQLLAAATVVVVLMVTIDVARRAFHSGAQSTPAPPVPAAVESVPPPPPAAGGMTQPGVTVAPVPAGPSYMDQVARAETRRQIRASAGRTYLNDIVQESGDSMLHRWDGRSSHPVRVYIPTNSRAANFQPGFPEAVRKAFRAWEAVGLPVRFDLTADSTAAEVWVHWRAQFDGDRTGQTDLQWDADGHLLTGEVTLATFDSDGRPLNSEGVRIVALHEIGHVLGLDHSPDSSDLMHSIATVRELSARDVETARLLYRLVPGSLR